MMKSKRTLAIVISAVIILIPAFSWILWMTRPEKKLNVVIIDKSVTDMKRTEHLAFSWTLRYDKYIKQDGKKYSLTDDYYGFLPLHPVKSRNYEIKRLKLSEIDSLAMNSDVIFYADNTGLLYTEWFGSTTGNSSNTQLLGGLKQSDYLLIKNAMENGKMIIAEYNFWGDPTEPLIRKKAENISGIIYTGWKGKYVNNLAQGKHAETPDWIVESYISKMGHWKFSGPGIVLVNEQGDVIVLEKENHLNRETPFITTNDDIAGIFGMEKEVPFLSWFEIVKNTEKNEVLSEFLLDVTPSGEELLGMHGLSSAFPAVVSHNGHYAFYYFAGNFSASDLDYFWSEFNWSDKFCFWFCGENQKSSRLFFYTYYYPFVSSILKDRYENLSLKN